MTYQRFDLNSGGRTTLTPIQGDLDNLNEFNDPTPQRHGLEALRKERGMSVLDLAHRAGLLPDHVRSLEAGLTPTLAEIQALARALKLPEEAIG
jgi:ABC-type antimicrobial peptide transport system ATPase subunit